MAGVLLKMFFSTDELQVHSRQQLGNNKVDQRGVEYNLALAQTITGGIKGALEHKALENLLTQNKNSIAGLFDFAGEDKALLPKAERIQILNKLKTEMKALLQKHDWLSETEKNAFVENLLGCPSYDIEHKEHTVNRLKKASKTELSNCILDRAAIKKSLHNFMAGDVNLIFSGIEKGLMLHQDDLKGAEATAEKFSNRKFFDTMQVMLEVPKSISTESPEKKTEIKTLLMQYANNYSDSILPYVYGAAVDHAQSNSAKFLESLQSIQVKNQHQEYFVKFFIASAFIQNEQFELVEKLFLELTEKHQNDLNIWAQQSDFYSNNYKNLLKAKACYEKLLTISPENKNALEFFASTNLIKASTFKQALMFSEKLTQIHPSNSIGWMVIGMLNGFEYNHFEVAESALKKARDNHPDPNIVNGLLVDLYLTFGKIEAAEAQAAEMDEHEEVKTSFNIVKGMTNTFFHQDYAKAQWHFEQVLDADPEDIFALILLGIINQYFLGKPVDAAQYFELAKSKEDFILSYPSVFISLIQFHQWDLVLQLVDGILEQNQEDIPNLAWLRFLTVIRKFIDNDKASDFIKIIHDNKRAEQWRPLVTALECIEAKKPQHLLGVAPEIRTPALQIIRQVSSDEAFNNMLEQHFPSE